MRHHLLNHLPLMGFSTASACVFYFYTCNQQLTCNLQLQATSPDLPCYVNSEVVCIITHHGKAYCGNHISGDHKYHILHLSQIYVLKMEFLHFSCNKFSVYFPLEQL